MVQRKDVSVSSIMICVAERMVIKIDEALLEIGVASATNPKAVEQMAITHLFGLRDYAKEMVSKT